MKPWWENSLLILGESKDRSNQILENPMEHPHVIPCVLMENPLELVHVHWLDDQRVCSAMMVRISPMLASPFQSIMVIVIGLDLQGTAT